MLRFAMMMMMMLLLLLLLPLLFVPQLMLVPCSALSLKYAGEVTHFLVETNEDGSVQVKDAPRSFPSLAALIFHHCQTPDGEN